jgi:uncharacterized membrane protein
MPKAFFPDRADPMPERPVRCVSFNADVGISKEEWKEVPSRCKDVFGLALAWPLMSAHSGVGFTTGGTMKALSILGVALIVLGLVALFAGGFSYTKDKDTADLGPIDITVKDKEHVHVPTPVSAGVIVLGVVLLFAGRRPRTA